MRHHRNPNEQLEDSHEYDPALYDEALEFGESENEAGDTESLVGEGEMETHA